MAFGHFFFETAGQKQVHPWGESLADFQWQFLRSHTSTALCDGYTKLDGSLHETEYVAPRDREGNPVHLSGLIFVKNEREVAGWQDACKRLCLGGERSYGWGRLALSKLVSDSANGWETDRERPVRQFGKDDTVDGHIDRSSSARVHGGTEVILRRLTANGQFGVHLAAPRFCWTPGAKMSAPAAVKLDGDGFLVDA